MKILFVHLSDIHIKCRTTFPLYKIQKLVQSLPPDEEIEKCVLVVSGDIADSGIKNEYVIAGKYFIGPIIREIKNKYKRIEHVDTLVVPGNHDRHIPHNDITNNITEENFPIYYKTEEINFKEFSVFSHYNRCFIDNLVYHKKLLKYKDFIIEANLINSALFSNLTDQKGKHFLPVGIIQQIMQSSKSDLTITILHHPISWFNWEGEAEFKDCLYKQNAIIFLGHEHDSHNITASVNGSNTLICNAGALSDNQTSASEFTSILFDTESFEHKTTSHIYDNDSKIFITKLLYDGKLKRSYYRLEPLPDFKDSLQKSTRVQLNCDIKNYFVLPDITYKCKLEDDSKNKKPLKIVRKEELASILQKNKRIIFEGDTDAGKTTILKYIYFESLKDKLPLFFASYEIREMKITNVIKRAIVEQYGDNKSNYDQFCQTPLDERIALIDDINRIENKDTLNKFLTEIQKYFGFIVLTSNTNYEPKTIDSIKQDLVKNNDFLIFSIHHFYGAKRTELIEKVVKCIKPSQNNNEIITDIERQIKNQIKLFDLTPYFIISYINSYIYDKQNNMNVGKNIFSKIFETNITLSITRIAGEKMMPPILLLLNELAYFIHTNKRYPFSQEDFYRIVNQHNENYASVESELLNPNQILNILLAANILTSISSNELRFVNTNYLAFFIASHINRLIKEERDNELLYNLVSNICFGINGDIILYLAYISGDNQIINSLLNTLIQLTKDWEEYSIDSKNLNLISDLPSSINKGGPTKEEIADSKESQAKSEEIIDTETIQVTDIYNYDESTLTSFHNQLLTSLKCTELIAKVLPSFASTLEKDKKNKLVDAIYHIPNKVLYYWFCDIDKHLESLIDDIYEIMVVKRPIITKEQIKEEIQDLVVAYVLSLYDYISQLCSDPQTMPLLDNFNYSKSSNYILQNIMMVSSSGDINEAIKRMDKSLNRNNVVKNMLSRIAWVILLRNSNLNRTTQDHILTKYFHGDKKAFLLAQPIKKR